MPINIALDSKLLSDGITHYHKLNFTRTPHILVFGITGSGKTFLVKLIMARIGLHIPKASVTVCDYKADDFHYLLGSTNHYEFASCADGLDAYYSAFLARQSGTNNKRNFQILVFDEWASFLNNLDKKDADTAKSRLSTLLMLGRSFNVHVLISQQRADAEYFSKSRDNFGLVIAMGNISKESAAMFGFDRELMEPVAGVGYGHILTNGTDMAAIKVPAVQNIAKLESYIRKAVSRPL
jgi:hypothetical protein